MIPLLLSLALFIQGIPVPAVESGKITGTLRNSSGMPLPQVRVAAMTQPDSALVSIAETDETGRYTLDNIPPGRYYITAGRVDFPTYYPGSQEMSEGKIVPVTAGAAISGIDFVMKDTSVRPPATFNTLPLAISDLTIPATITVEGSGKLPVFSPRGYPMITVTRTADGTQSKWPLDSSFVTVSGYPAEYRVSLENLPEGYVAKSLIYGSTNLAADTMKILAANSQPPAGTVLTQRLTIVPGQTSFALATFFSTAAGTAIVPPSILSITLAATAVPPTSAGARVTGYAKGITPRWVYLSDRPGTLYADGSFEFRGISPGRHAIVTLDNPNTSSPFGAFVVVGNQDLNGVQLEETPVLPYDVRSPAAPDDGAGSRTPGIVPAASLKGILVREPGRDPVPKGTVFVVGHSWASFQIDADGKFEVPRLLPGKYDLEIQAIGYPTVRRSLVVCNDDLSLDLSPNFTESPGEP